MRLFGTVATVIAGLLAADDALACRGSQFHTVTLMDALPANAASEEVVARVEVIELLAPGYQTPGYDVKYTGLVRVRVVEAIKGIQLGQTFRVHTRGSSCDQYFSIDSPNMKLKEWRPYIAGRFVKDDSGENIFRGAWKYDGSKVRW